MTCEARSGPSLWLGDSFQSLLGSHGHRLLVAGVVALAGHALGGWYAGSVEPSAAAPPAPVEVELAFREPPPPIDVPEPPPAAEPPAPRPAVAPKPAPSRQAAAAPPPAARAGAVLTAAPSTPEPSAAEPFDFTSDPSSRVYGAGVVAVGGTAAYGAAGARAGGSGQAPLRAAARGDGLTALEDLSERPRLRQADPCRGYFPARALSDRANVTVRVVIARHGAVTQASVISESPRDQGFGSAARTCMLAQRFVPALDRKGQPAATALNVNVTFKR